MVRFLRPEEGKVDVGYIAHPGFVELDELSAITGPLSIAAAGESLFCLLYRYKRVRLT